LEVKEMKDIVLISCEVLIMRFSHNSFDFVISALNNYWFIVLNRIE